MTCALGCVQDEGIRCKSGAVPVAVCSNNPQDSFTTGATSSGKVPEKGEQARKPALMEQDMDLG